MSFSIRNGWAVPDGDTQCFDTVIREVADIRRILPHCDNRRVCVQAGGNIGIWAIELAKHFDTVYTFEPDRDNFDALSYNVRQNKSPVIATDAALGDCSRRGAIHVFEPGNIGAHQVKNGDEFDVITIDSLNLTGVDLIQLDVEGYEHYALIGAMDTIKRCSPVICVELKGLGDKHGFTDEMTRKMLEGIGYVLVERFHRDLLFIKK